MTELNHNQILRLIGLSFCVGGIFLIKPLTIELIAGVILFAFGWHFILKGDK